MKRLLGGLILGLAVVALTGCTSAVGHWKMESITPETAKKDFQFCMMCLSKDGQYMACAMAGDEPKKMTGTYKYDASAKTLTFTGSDGKERAYQAEVTNLGCKMKVSSEAKGKEWTAVMKKGQCCCDKWRTGKGCDPKACGMPKCCPGKCEATKAEPKKAELKKPEAKKAEPKPSEPKKAEPPEKSTKAETSKEKPTKPEPAVDKEVKPAGKK